MKLRCIKHSMEHNIRHDVYISNQTRVIGYRALFQCLAEPTILTVMLLVRLGCPSPEPLSAIHLPILIQRLEPIAVVQQALRFRRH
jgi:hypothetical protein